MLKFLSIILFVAMTRLLSETVPRIELRESGELLASEIRSKIPLDIDLTTAKRILEINKFSCERVKRGSFLDRKNIDFFYCSLENGSWFFVSKRWQVALVDENGKLKDVIASYGLTGP